MLSFSDHPPLPARTEVARRAVLQVQLPLRPALLRRGFAWGFCFAELFLNVQRQHYLDNQPQTPPAETSASARRRETHAGLTGWHTLSGRPPQHCPNKPFEGYAERNLEGLPSLFPIPQGITKTLCTCLLAVSPALPARQWWQATTASPVRATSAMPPRRVRARARCSGAEQTVPGQE